MFVNSDPQYGFLARQNSGATTAAARQKDVRPNLQFERRIGVRRYGKAVISENLLDETSICLLQFLLGSLAAADQVNDSHDDGDHQQQVDQAAGYMESPTEKPEYDQDGENSPKH
jgi:hypothetical protein